MKGIRISLALIAAVALPCLAQTGGHIVPDEFIRQLRGEATPAIVDCGDRATGYRAGFVAAFALILSGN